MSGRIIQIKEEGNGMKPTLLIKGSKRRYCTHPYIDIDLDEREVRCQDCNAVLEPFEWILSLAYQERNQISALRELRKSVEELQQQKEQLQKEVNDLKAKKRNLIKH